MQDGQRIRGLVVIGEPAGRRDELVGKGLLHRRGALAHALCDDRRRRPRGGLRRQHRRDVEVDRRGGVVADGRQRLFARPLGLQPVAEGEAAGAPGARRPNDRAVADRPDEVDPLHHGRQASLRAPRGRRSAARASTGPRRSRRPSRSSRRSRDICRDAAASGRGRHAARRRPRAGRPSRRAAICEGNLRSRADSRRSRQRPARRRSSRAARRVAGNRSALR